MIKNLIPTIGVEVHCTLNTKSKMFSSSSNQHKDLPNTNLHPLDLGMPGVLPTVNKNAVKKAIVLAHALNMKIEDKIIFDRKNYFYQDLPKGFQLTQQYYPIGKDGTIKINDHQQINIERIHIEEDTAKEQTINGKIYLDYNRCGCPLIEIVSKPDMHSASEVVEYLTNLKRLLIFLDISDGKMEDGSLRADINISLAPRGSNQLGTRIELKNINSFANVEKAINYEIERQNNIILANKSWTQATFRWDESLNQTVFMRSKEASVDYHYFTEPNIIQIKLDPEFVDETLASVNKTPREVEKELQDLKINPLIINQLLDNFHLYQVFKKVYSATNDVNLTLTWVVVEFLSYLKKVNQPIDNINDQQVDLLIKLIQLLQLEELNGKQAKQVIIKMLDELKDPSVVAKELNLVQIKDPNVLKPMIEKIVSDNIKMLDQLDTRAERVMKMFIGLVMKNTNGQANPNVVNQILNELINQYKK